VSAEGGLFVLDAVSKTIDLRAGGVGQGDDAGSAGEFEVQMIRAGLKVGAENDESAGGHEGERSDLVEGVAGADIDTLERDRCLGIAIVDLDPIILSWNRVCQEFVNSQGSGGADLGRFIRCAGRRSEVQRASPPARPMVRRRPADRRVHRLVWRWRAGAVSPGVEAEAGVQTGQIGEVVAPKHKIGVRVY
jgi:hypothetical protein